MTSDGEEVNAFVLIGVRHGVVNNEVRAVPINVGVDQNLVSELLTYVIGSVALCFDGNAVLVCVLVRRFDGIKIVCDTVADGAELLVAYVFLI